MDFDEFEKVQEKKQQPSAPARFACGPTNFCRPGPPTSRNAEGGALGQLEEWEDYMQWGFAGLSSRDFERQ